MLDYSNTELWPSIPNWGNAFFLYTNANTAFRIRYETGCDGAATDPLRRIQLTNVARPNLGSQYGLALNIGMIG